MDQVAVAGAEFELTFSDDGAALVAGPNGGFEQEAGFEVGGRVIEHAFSAYFPPAVADLIDVAMAVYTADRLCPRRPPNPNRYEHYWHRRIFLHVPLREPGRWQDPEVSRRLRRVLSFLTEDDWTFRFVPRSIGFREKQGYLFPTRPPAPARVALFSGGLDSLAGCVAELQRFPNHSFVLFSGYTNSRLCNRQRELFDTLSKRGGPRIVPVMVPFGLRRQNGSYDDEERTQRTRGFVYSAMGAAVSLSAGSCSLACHENGIGALNLPLTAAQLGAQNSRSAHPRALGEMAQLIEIVTEREFQIELPFLFQTKAELCESLVRSNLPDMVSRTVSCDTFPRRVKGSSQCGECTSCLLRRQALHAAGLSAWDHEAGYEWDVKAEASNDPKSFPYDLNAMLDQVWRFRRAVSAGDPWIALAGEFPDLEATVLWLEAQGCEPVDVRRRLLCLVRRYCDEWDRFAQRSLPLPPSAA